MCFLEKPLRSYGALRGERPEVSNRLGLFEQGHPHELSREKEEKYLSENADSERKRQL
jgi:hypothetical protein